MLKFDLNDILICPAVLSSIQSRVEVNPYYKTHLPIIAAPMDTVVSEDNIKYFVHDKINFCLPRGVDIKDGDDRNGYVMCFKSYGLEEFKGIFLVNLKPGHCVVVPYKYLLIDIANGHMEELLEVIKLFKKNYGNMYKLMVGNVANPETYRFLSKAGADFIRVGIGAGNGCLTSVQTGVGYPIGSLISACNEIKNELAGHKENYALIVTDGGMKSYSDIIKALALGADYVMVGSILNKALESAGPTTLFGFRLNQHSEFTEWLFNKGFPIKKKFRGMSTKEVQKDWGRTELKTSEGVIRYRNVEYTLQQWVNNFEHYLKSAMSYSDSRELLEFIGLAQTNQITDNAYKRFNK